MLEEDFGTFLESKAAWEGVLGGFGRVLGGLGGVRGESLGVLGGAWNAQEPLKSDFEWILEIFGSVFGCHV